MAGLRDRLDRVIDSAIDDRRIVGAVVLIWRNGEPAYERAAGLADREAGREMRADAIFRFSSLTKPLVAATALALIERGVLSRDAAVTDWLPDFRPQLPDGSAPDITIQRLLTHTAGFAQATHEPGHPYAEAGVSGGLDFPGRGMEENLARLASVPLFYAPGTAWQYGVATDILGAIVAQANGGTLGEAVAEFVTGPLAMPDTAFAVTDASRLCVAYADADGEPERMSDPHTIAVGRGKGTVFSPSRILDPRSYHSGNGGMAGTGPDFMRYLEAVRTGGGPILRPGTVDLALQNHVGELRESIDPGTGFGLISAIVTDPGRFAWPYGRGTAFWGGVYGHRWFIDRNAGLSAVSLTNTAVEGGWGFAHGIAGAIYG